MLQRAKLLFFYEERIPESLQALVYNAFPIDEFEIVRSLYTISDMEIIEKIKWSEIVMFAPGRFLSDEILAHGSHIKLMQLWSSGYDKFNTAGAAKFGIPVANNGGSNAQSVAEHAVMLMLAICKWLPDSHRRTVEGCWAGNSHGMDMSTLNGKTLGLIGFGNIGQGVARIAGGFGMDIRYHDLRRASKEIESELRARVCDFEELLLTSDFISLHLHLNDETRRMIGPAEFEKMKSTATLINMSRSQLVDNEALLVALNKKLLWAAGLDVFETEPTSRGDPLLEHPHVVATPHMGGSTIDAYRRSLSTALENFRRVLRGETPKCIVNGVSQPAFSNYIDSAAAKRV